MNEQTKPESSANPPSELAPAADSASLGVMITRPAIIVGADLDAMTITVRIVDRPIGIRMGDASEVTYIKHEVTSNVRISHGEPNA